MLSVSETSAQTNSTAFQQILRFAQDDKRGAQDDKNNLVMLNEVKHLPVFPCHVERKRNICPNHSTTFQQILRFAQDDKKEGAQDDSELSF